MWQAFRRTRYSDITTDLTEGVPVLPEAASEAALKDSDKLFEDLTNNEFDSSEYFVLH